MARMADLPPAFSEHSEDDEGDSSEDLLLKQRQESRWSLPRVAVFGLAAGALVACAVLFAAQLPRSSSASSLSGSRPSTVRQLLEGPEFADAVTDNFMNLGHSLLRPDQRGEVRSAVADNLANISDSLRRRLPGEHRQLDTIQLSQEQKSSVLRVLRHYSDPRVLRLGNDIAQTVAETRAEAGDKQSLHRRLAEKLRPRLRELKELCDDIVPGSGKYMNLEAGNLADIVPAEQVAGSWNFKVEMSAPKAAHPGPATGLPAARRLASTDTLSGTRDQATIALQHMEGMLGKSMPSAPARMLLFDKQKEMEQQTTGWERFEQCVMDNMSSIPDLFTCLMSNCKRAMSWLMNKFHLADFAEKVMSSAA